MTITEAPKCAGPDCTRSPRGNGRLCNAHRQQLTNNGTLIALGPHRRKTSPAVEVALDLGLVALPDLPGYGVHRVGQVWAVGTNWRNYGARPITPKTNVHGYREVFPVIEGKRTRMSLHRLVCRAFHGAPDPDQQARHLNGDKTDNRAANLAWGTAKENADDRERHGRSVRGTNVPQSKLTEAQVLEIRARRGAGETLRAIGDGYGISQTMVSYIARRIWWAHL